MKILLKKSLIRKAKRIRVKPHIRRGKHVKGHERTGKSKKFVPKYRANKTQMNTIIEHIDKNMGYLVYMGKVIGYSHGLDVQFHYGQPINDLADLIAEGKHGMIIGGMEWLKTSERKKPQVDQLTQMKTRAKQRMRNIAKRLRGNVKLPRDVIRDLAIVSSARKRLAQQKGSLEYTPEEVADMVTLRRRTRAGGYEELTKEEGVERVRALSTFGQAQIREEFDIHPFVSEANVEFWTKYTIEQRKRRELVNIVIEDLVKNKKITEEMRDIIYLKFYFDHPTWARKQRSFETIAKMFDEKMGIKYVRVRKKIGDNYRFKTRRHKTPVTGKIIKIDPKTFVVQRGKTKYRIRGKPPLVRVKGLNKAVIFDKYKKAISILMKHPDLKKVWEMMKSFWTKISETLALFANQEPLHTHTTLEQNDTPVSPSNPP